MYYSKMWRDDEKEHGECCPRDGFRFVVISRPAPNEFEKEIGDALPLDTMKPIVLTDTWEAGQL